MSSAIISVERLGKKYRIAHQKNGSGYKTFRDTVGSKLRSVFNGKSADPGGSSSSEDFWALKDVSFEINQGDVVGIIGRNGAGKSTLLKVLSRITEPTEGRIHLKGRVASLLEVGTGFHPELTGRENIFLNGAILGMNRLEIRAKFDEIVAFAEIEKFLDTPVKRYSSGMYVRLAFAVAAHLDPEILIVDEVLAVGDAQFQKKCLGKMQNISQKEGRTVLFVSHNTAAISSLTGRVVLLEGGRNKFTGLTELGIQQYLLVSSQSSGAYDATPALSGKPIVSSIRIDLEGGSGIHVSGKDMTLTFKIHHPKPISNACFSFQIVNQFHQPIVHCWIYDADSPICRKGEFSTLTCRIPNLALNVGVYSLNTFLSEPPGGALFEKLEGVCPFSVQIIGRHTLFGWRPEACAYISDFQWNSQ